MEITLRTSTINTQAKANRKIEYIVIHYTAGTTSKAGTAINTANYFKTANNVSSDFIVDDTTIVQYNPDIKNIFCWHCGGTRYHNKGGRFYGVCRNDNSIGIEICCMNTTGKMQDANSPTYYFTPASLNNAAELVKKLMGEYKIPVSNIVRHYDVTGKPCPGINGWNLEKYSDGEQEWEKFKSRFTNTKDTKNAETKTDSTWYTIQVGAWKSKENAENYLKEVHKHYPNAIIKIRNDK